MKKYAQIIAINETYSKKAFKPGAAMSGLATGALGPEIAEDNYHCHVV